jgi:hypothetical protein
MISLSLHRRRETRCEVDGKFLPHRRLGCQLVSEGFCYSFLHSWLLMRLALLPHAFTLRRLSGTTETIQAIKIFEFLFHPAEGSELSVVGRSTKGEGKVRGGGTKYGGRELMWEMRQKWHGWSVRPILPILRILAGHY